MDVTVCSSINDPVHLHLHALLILDKDVEDLEQWIWKTYKRIQNKRGIQVHKKGYDLQDIKTGKEVTDYIVKTLGTLTYEMTSTNKEGRDGVSKGFFKWLVDIVQDPSAPEAFVNGIMEGVEWVWDNGILKARDIEIIETEIKTAKNTTSSDVEIRAFKNFLSKLVNK